MVVLLEGGLIIAFLSIEGLLEGGLNRENMVTLKNYFLED